MSKRAAKAHFRKVETGFRMKMRVKSKKRLARRKTPRRRFFGIAQ
jgi:hypothetical protein